MKTWFDWMEEYYIPRPQPEGAQAGEADRILALTRQKLGLPGGVDGGAVRKTHSIRRPVRRLWALAAAAALLLCLGVGTMAVGVFPWGTVGDFFGVDGQQQAARLGMPGEGLSLSQTKDGVTVTLDGILDDGATAYIPAQLTLADGQYDPTLQYHCYALLSRPVAAADDRASGCADRPLEDADPSDSTIPLMLTASHEGLQPGDTVELTIYYIFGNTTLYDGSTKTSWSWEHEITFTFALPEFQPAVTVSVPEGTVEPDTGIPIAQVSLTPMQVEVTFAEHPDDSAVRDQLSRLPMSLTFTDGSTLVLPKGWGKDSGVRSADGGQGFYTIGCEFGRLIDPATIAAVTVNGVELRVG